MTRMETADFLAAAFTLIGRRARVWSPSKPKEDPPPLRVYVSRNFATITGDANISLREGWSDIGEIDLEFITMLCTQWGIKVEK